jgi:NDP-sugar pyrophosphorylase family protein
VLPGAFIADGAELTDSVIGADARVESGAVIDGYTVLGDGVRAEAGERLHGVRRPSDA